MTNPIDSAWVILKEGDELASDPSWSYVTEMLDAAAQALEQASPKEMEGMGILQGSQMHSNIWVAKKLVEDVARIVHSLLEHPRWEKDGSGQVDRPMPGTEEWLDEIHQNPNPFGIDTAPPQGSSVGIWPTGFQAKYES